jgi:GTP-binding protein EngB required for normal cell division
MGSQNSPSAGLLNEFQARRLLVTCQYIDKLLGEVGDILNVAASKAAFPRYSGDIAPAQRRTIEDYISRIRAQLVRVLDGQGVPREPPSIPASRAIHVNMGAIDIAVEELKPQYMRGYGDVSETVATELNGIVGELRSLVSKLDRYLAEGVGQDLQLRLQRLEQKSNDLDLLSRIEEVVAQHGLVEFRPTIASILDRTEDKTFEIAVFGRVSSGKSSLLNAILKADVLPVGVTPITSVPTRIAYGERASMEISFAESPSKTMEVTRLAEFATEQQNPGNAKRVTRITVTLPAARLRDGVTLVDTPGFGSLATSGAAETLAYLPRCDLGVVLIDAGSTLTTEDLQTLLTLQQAAVPANVLLSKADLLRLADREKITEHARQHIASECNLELQVHPVSVLASHKELLNRWFEEQILPLYSKAQELKTSSLRRKIGALRESVIAALQVRLQRNHMQPPSTETQLRACEARLRAATGKIEELRSTADREIDKMPHLSPRIFEEVAAELVSAGSPKGLKATSASGTVRELVAKAVYERARLFHEHIDALARYGAGELVAVANILGLSGMPAETEFDGLVRGAPVFELSGASVEASQLAFSLFFGKGFAVKRLARRLRKQIGSELDQTLASYSKSLRSWVMSALNQLEHAFEVYAENYRAYIERTLTTVGPDSSETDAITRDLELLGSALGRLPAARGLVGPQAKSLNSAGARDLLLGEQQ